MATKSTRGTKWTGVARELDFYYGPLNRTLMLEVVEPNADPQGLGKVLREIPKGQLARMRMKKR
jgi:hypothetical protein